MMKQVVPTKYCRCFDIEGRVQNILMPGRAKLLLKRREKYDSALLPTPVLSTQPLSMNHANKLIKLFP